MNIETIQKAICEKHGAIFLEAPEEYKVGISNNFKASLEPIHALRHKMENGTTGWYIWAGDYKEDADFFKPLHVKHLKEWCPIILPYLGLAPGWRVLIAKKGEYIDVWYDPSLI